MTSNAYDAYTTIGTSTADPVTLTTMLYDGAVKAMKKARIYAENGNRQRFLDETGRAHLIIGELLATLDREKGGEIADNLAAIYAYCLRCLVDSTMGDMEKLDEAQKHISRIGEAWKTATSNLRIESAAFSQRAVA
ncbi:MAG: flagellar export chaperone FliS [Hyphomicrobiales bacterium]